MFLILRELSIKDGGAATVNFDALVAEVKAQKLEKGQSSPLELRLKLLKALMEKFNKEWLKGWKKRRPAQKGMDIWSFEPGTLTIIDLSDPWINGGAACALFDVCLHLFQGLGPKTGKIVALDEAHKVSFSRPTICGSLRLNHRSL